MREAHLAIGCDFHVGETSSCWDRIAAKKADRFPMPVSGGRLEGSKTMTIEFSDLPRRW